MCYQEICLHESDTAGRVVVDSHDTVAEAIDSMLMADKEEAKQLAVRIRFASDS